MVQKNATIDDTPSVIAAPLPASTGDESNLKVDSYGALWTVQTQIGVEETILASAARTTLQAVSVTNTRYKGVTIVIDVTVDAAAASITPRIDGWSSLGSDWYNILTGSAIAAVGVTVLRVYPTMTASANLIAVDVLPPTWRFGMAVADADAITYSVNAIHMP